MRIAALDFFTLRITSADLKWEMERKRGLRFGVDSAKKGADPTTWPKMKSLASARRVAWTRLG